MPKYVGESKIPVMEFCEYCWEVLNDDGTCPTGGCIHNDLMGLVGSDSDVTNHTQL